jgi:hypothetical protein
MGEKECKMGGPLDSDDDPLRGALGSLISESGGLTFAAYSIHFNPRFNPIQFNSIVLGE